MRKAILLKPLDGQPEGARRTFNNDDFENLARFGALKLAPDDDDEEPTALPLIEPTLDELRAAHADELKAALDQAGKYEAELISVRQELADTHQKASDAENAVQVGLQRIEELTGQLEAARAAPRPADMAEGEANRQEGAKAAEDPQNKMQADPANKVTAPSKAKSVKAD